MKNIVYLLLWVSLLMAGCEQNKIDLWEDDGRIGLYFVVPENGENESDPVECVGVPEYSRVLWEEFCTELFGADQMEDAVNFYTSLVMEDNGGRPAYYFGDTGEQTIDTVELVVGYTVEDQPVTTIPIQLVHDYELTVSAIQTLSSSDDLTVYFEKGTDIVASLEVVTNTTLTASSIWVNGQKYDLTGTGNNRYTFTLKGYDKSGVQTLTPEKIQMSNGKELDVTDAADSRIEILKDAPTVKGFVSEQTDRNKLKVSFTLSDNEDTVSAASLVITDENGGKLLEKAVSVGANEAEMDLNSSRSYQAKVTASYDRDTNALGDDSNSFTV